MKVIKIIVALTVLTLTACTTPMNKEGYSKPTIMTQAPGYLKSFPLGRISKTSLLENLGIPDKTSKLDDKTYYSYELGEGYGLRQFVYEITDDKVTDVRFHDQGPYNGMSAKKQQGLK